MSNFTPTTVLSIAGAAGVIVTSVLAINCHLKAKDILDDMEFDEDSTPTERFVDAAKATWTDYIPAVISGGVTVACILGANHIHLRTEAALITAMGVLGTKLRSMNKSVIEEFGKEKYEEIKKKISLDSFKNDKKKYLEYKKNHKVNDPEWDIYYEPITDQYFSATKKDILLAETELNKRFHSAESNGEVSLYELLEMLPGDLTADGTSLLGWYMGDGATNFEKSQYGYYISLNPTYEEDGGHQRITLNYSIPPYEPSQEYVDTMSNSSFRRLVKRRAA